MPAHPADGRQRPLQIHRRPVFELRQRRLPESLRGQPHGEVRGVEFRHGEAGAVDGDAVAEANAVKDGLRLDLHVEAAVWGSAELLDGAHFFHDAGEEAPGLERGGIAAKGEGGFGFWKEGAERGGFGGDGVECEVVVEGAFGLGGLGVEEAGGCGGS